jgi:hypothetical protein
MTRKRRGYWPPEAFGPWRGWIGHEAGLRCQACIIPLRGDFPDLDNLASLDWRVQAYGYWLKVTKARFTRRFIVTLAKRRGYEQRRDPRIEQAIFYHDVQIAAALMGIRP